MVYHGGALLTDMLSDCAAWATVKEPAVTVVGSRATGYHQPFNVP